MEYRTQIISAPATSAATFFERLNEAGVRYGIFKSSRNTLMALAGDQDLDILVAREDYHRFCAIASECAGIRSVNHRSLVSPAREDWFIPDFERAKYLHLDVHTSVRLGGKFSKRYPCYAYSDIHQWHTVSLGGCSIPMVSPMDEAVITLSRIAFRFKGEVSGPWQKLTGDWAQEIDQLLFGTAETGEKSVRQERSGLELRCRVRKHGGDVWVHREDLASIRRSVKAHRGSSGLSAFTDSISNLLGTWHYAASRFMNRVIPGFTIDRRRPASGGLIVAVVAPDGLGKTTQVERMSALFNWKFCCVSLYLGTGDGRGWWPRRLLRALYIRRRSKINETLLDDTAKEGGSRGLKSRLGSLLLAMWGLLAALERHARVRAARRMADRGFIVFCDRWPQSIQPGFMDGPTRPRPDSPGLLRSWELSLYDRMSRVQPDVTIHLIGDYETSQARKPGELDRQAFDKRVALMKDIQAKAPRIHVIDAGRSREDVSKALFELIWKAL
jgi:thymidylate kinase